MANIFVDLHTHTTASDGTDSPAEVVRKAAAAGLAALAVTDHDTLAGLEEAQAEAKRLGLEFVRGCEISARSIFGEVHLLGLWLPESPTLLAPLELALAGVREDRAARNRRILDKLAGLGLPVRHDEFLALAGDAVAGRPHIAEYLCRLGVTATRKEAFARFLREGAPAYVPRETLTPEAAVALLADAGATVCFAHPRLGHRSQEQTEQLVAGLIPLGLTAIEAYHSEHSAGDERWCVGVAAKYGLLLSGGSDYHGDSKPGVVLGRGKGGLRVTRHVLDTLKAARHEMPRAKQSSNNA